jgi:hypothetical protein
VITDLAFRSLKDFFLNESLAGIGQTSRSERDRAATAAFTEKQESSRRPSGTEHFLTALA